VPEVIAQVTATAPAKVFREFAVTVYVLPVVAPEVKVSEPDAGVSVKVGVTVVTVTVVEAVVAMDELAVVPVPVTVAVRTPLVPAVVAMVTTVVAVPPEDSVTEAGKTEQVPAAVPEPLRLAAVQARATLPTKPFVEATVTVLVTVFPEMSVPAVGSAAGDGVRVKAEAVRLTVMVAELTVVDPLTPLTLTLRMPEVPVVVAMVSVLVAVLPAVSVAAFGRMVQLPAALPLAVVTAQLSCRVAAKLFTEVMVMASGLVVAPEIRL